MHIFLRHGVFANNITAAARQGREDEAAASVTTAGFFSH